PTQAPAQHARRGSRRSRTDRHLDPSLPHKARRQRHQGIFDGRRSLRIRHRHVWWGPHVARHPRVGGIVNVPTLRGSLLAITVIALALSAGCSKESAKPTLTWYVNPDPAQLDEAGNPLGQRRLAKLCSTDKYAIEVEVLPTSATEQRIQL